METSILWTGREYNSLEHALIRPAANGHEIVSTILGFYKQVIYKVNYRIVVNALWQTVRVEVNSLTGNRNTVLVLESDGKGRWTAAGKPVPAFDGCIDVDIPLTPFTNTLPVNRLKLHEKQEARIHVLYLDLLNNEVKPVYQEYTRLSADTYHYENVPNDFEADIMVDHSGLVLDYPGLFVRTAVTETAESIL